ncbi:MAG TPA: hypothetical protein DCK83_03765 [Gallionellaceae bacterium]|nr:hypothetical protein [Gallionellaceae bacterium]
MASRPIFRPKNQVVGVSEDLLEFSWFPGMAASQKKKSIKSLHEAARNCGFGNILEISSKSEDDLGIALSAFNLIIKTKKHGNEFTVETAFQGSKVFERGGPFTELLGLDSLKAKKDIRLKESGNLIAFYFFGMKFPIIPRTYFYDWLYINALNNNPTLADRVKLYDSFSDIEFNPKRSINCQAHSVALYLSLIKNSKIEKALESPQSFLDCTKQHYEIQKRNIGIQDTFI